MMFLSESTVAKQPVRLEVRCENELGLWVEREETNTKHTITGQLTNHGNGVGDKTVKITINGKEYTKTTSSEGYFTLEFDLQPKDDKLTVYEVLASFEGYGLRARTKFQSIFS